jgi:hypothetical protein
MGRGGEHESKIVNEANEVKSGTEQELSNLVSSTGNLLAPVSLESSCAQICSKVN